MLKANGIPFEFEQSKQNGIITPSSIGEKTLYYNASELSQMSSVQSMLDDENYKALMERLQSKNLPISMNILLHGAPGTGKTESVLQLARISGREIMKVEISQTKSMWFGESEKIIKKVFTDYTKYSDRCKKTPILFFNEADAILGKRNELNGNVSQTQNTIQNILLEELENFKGIFMATTNLANNLDKAFERRFLFKVEFQKPTIESRTKIWMNKLSFLLEQDACILAQQFELSGGQIENVVRKSEIEFILNGQDVNVETLLKFCSEETLLNGESRNVIGF
jgi:SpoVK/Ycf46/Vps4 family AAA+-type ATPase